MVYRREKALLTLMEQLGKPITSLKLQKLLFILCEATEERYYDFLPYRYGCYSFQLTQDLKHLETNGYIQVFREDDNPIYSLTSYNLGLSKYVDYHTQCQAIKIAKRYGELNSKQLIEYTYNNYPFYAINSTILEKVCTPNLKAYISSIKPKKEERCLMTIGYEGLSLESYMVTLIRNDVRVLCDVRKNAYSQKFGFSKACYLKKACEGIGIIYLHLPELGIVSEKRQNLYSQNDYDKLFEEYEQTVLLKERAALNKLYMFLQQYGRIALTCFEHNPLQCHRSRIANKLINIPQCNYTLLHL